MKKTFTMIFSFLIHSTVIFAVIVGPLMKTEEVLPDIKVVDIFVAQTPPQPPQAQRGSKKKKKAKTKREEKKQEEVKKEVPQQIGALVAPVEIPEEIVEEEEDFSSIDDGLEGGVEGGVEGLGDEDLGSNIIGGDMMDTGSVTRISVKQARRIKYVKPIYPKIAMNARVRGRVVIEAKTDVFGKVVSWRVIAGHPLLNGAAINAIKKWEYEPYLVGGVPKPVVFTVTITFSQSK
jgi:TonB family protein